ncbi:MAG: hypothetical protein LBF37_04345 [Rickettsiales bacterium]|jgi:hypothetical protein|nr:hypothetical protein [Rickettsiales bacterium]
MKKISILAILSVCALPAFAETGVTSVPTGETFDLEPMAIETEYVAEVAPKKSNAKTKFPRGMQIGVGASATSGLNGFIGYANKDFESFWWKRLGVRFDFASTSLIKSSINSAIDSALEDGVDIGDGMTLGGGSAKGHHIGAFVDFYPFGNTFLFGGIRFTGGYVTGKTNVAATLDGEFKNIPGGAFEFELNGIDYRYLGDSIKASADVDWKYSGPYLGTGFDLGLFWGVKIFMDAGVVFTSKTASVGLDIPLNNLEVSHNGGSSWNSVSNPTLEAELDAAKAAALADVNNELDDIKFYPMVKLGFMYRF